MTDEEVWLDVQGYENIYQISNIGRLIVLVKSVRNKLCLRKVPKILKPYLCKITGYYRVTLGKYEFHEKRELRYIHRLVAFSFIPNPENKPEVNHKFGIKTDNRATQLEWATRPENIQHGFKMGLIKALKGEEAHNSILTNDKVLFILNNATGPRELARQMGLSYSTVNSIKNGSSWNHITGLPKKKWKIKI